jgi:hypothetical protein
MDALKRAVDLMDESAVKLSSARGRYVIWHIASHHICSRNPSYKITSTRLLSVAVMTSIRQHHSFRFCSMMLSLSLAESQGRTAIYHARNASAATATSLLF